MAIKVAISRNRKLPDQARPSPFPFTRVLEQIGDEDRCLEGFRLGWKRG